MIYNLVYLKYFISKFIYEIYVVLKTYINQETNMFVIYNIKTNKDLLLIKQEYPAKEVYTLFKK